MKTYKSQVIIAGGGPTGIAAAISAARKGAEVLLIEQYGCLGGMSTVGGVAPWMTFHAKDGTQTIKGIGEEIVQKLIKMGASPGHVSDTMGETCTITPFSSEALKELLAQMALEANVKILYHTYIFDVEKHEDKIIALRAANKNGEIRIEGNYFVDGTGDADVAAFAGCAFEKGENNNGKVQPVSMNFTMANVDFEKVRQYMIANPNEFHFRTRFDELEKDLPYSISGFYSIWKKSVSEMDIDIQRDRFLFFRSYRDDIATVNTTRILGIDSTDADSLTKAELVGRHQAMEVSRKMIEYIPGFENAYLSGIASAIGIRESRRIIGEYVLQIDDLIAGKRFEDDLCIDAYTVDRHQPEGHGFDQYEVKPFGIPYRSMLTKEFRNLAVGGRSISTDVLGQSATRTTPACFAMGEGIGIAISIAIKDKVEALKDINIKKLRVELINNGVYL